MCGTCGFFRTMHRGVSAPSCCAFIHRVAFKEVSGHRVLFKSIPENWGLSACGTTHEATSQIFSLDRPHPEVRREGWEPLPDKARESTLSRNQEGRSGSDEVVPGTSVFPSRETRVSGNFWKRIKGAKFSHLKCENTSRRNLGRLFRRCSGQGPHLAMTG